MWSFRSFSFLFALSLLLVVSPLNASAAYTPDRDPAVTGRVVDANGVPVYGALVSIVGTAVQTTTNESGVFALYNLKPGTYELKVNLLGYKTISQNIEVVAGQATQLDLAFEEAPFIIPELLVVGRTDRALSQVPGAAAYINQKTLIATAPLSGNEVFRQVPGVHVVDEEGLGMRLNLGIRGLNPDRSRSILILEDGIPVSIAPYGEPEMYYTPPIDRMSGVEVVKGAGQILFGPQTIGGVVNYISAPPPDAPTLRFRLQGGQGGYLNNFVTYGDRAGSTGYQVSLLHKRADRVGMTRFGIIDVHLKTVTQLNKNSAVALKVGVYDENSNSTYIGMTQTMYDRGGQDFQHLAPHDGFALRRYNFSAVHDYKFNSALQLRTSAFAYTTTRNWRRQDFTYNTGGAPPPANWSGTTWGDTSVAGGAIYMLQTNAHRNRHFEVGGSESRLEYQKPLLGLNNNLVVGARLLFEKAYERRLNGSYPAAPSGALVEDETRPARAISAYIQDEITVLNGLKLHAGVRFEDFSYSRHILRRTFTINGTNQVRDTSLLRSNHMHQFIPGGGFIWQASNRVQVYGGVHVGFAPPRIKDDLTATGVVHELAAEQSVNSELGVRFRLPGISAEITGFNMDFSNQVIPVSQSSGGTGAGLVNGGQTIHRGVEGMVQANIAEWAGWTRSNLLFSSALTYADARFGTGRQIDGRSLEGNFTPYAPQWLANTALTLERQVGVQMRISHQYTGAQFTDELNTETPAPNGRVGLMPAFQVVDAMIGYRFPWKTTFQFTVKNVFNERYIASRRPQGMRVGLDRFFFAGVVHNF